MILNQTSRNKGCCDLKGPWDHFRVFNSCIKKEEEKKKLHEEETRKKGSIKEREKENGSSNKNRLKMPLSTSGYHRSGERYKLSVDSPSIDR